MSLKLKSAVAVSDSGFVFNSVSGHSYSVNPIGAEILNMLKEHKGTEEIKRYILNTYDTDTITFEKDFYDFVNQLISFHLADKEDEE